jgi:hypothetical protein
MRKTQVASDGFKDGGGAKGFEDGGGAKGRRQVLLKVEMPGSKGPCCSQLWRSQL